MTSSESPMEHFRCALDTMKKFGTDGNGEVMRYVPYGDLKHYWSSERINSVLQSCTLPTSMVDDIYQRFLRIFSILVFIDRPQYLKVFRRRGINDENLPFSGHWPYRTNEGDDFQLALRDIYQNQWTFCPIEFGQKIMYKRKLETCQILPFVREQNLGAGGFAECYKVRIHSSHSIFQEPVQEEVFAVKEFPRATRHNFDAELEALAALSRRPSQHIVQCVGSYVQGNKYHLVLEYANHGSLKEYLQSSSPPCSALGLQRFWNNAMGLLQGLRQIHNTSLCDTKTGSMVGIHADITPQNILVFGNNEEPSYDVTFKISDFRMSSIKSSVGNNTPVVGTDTYAAPEYSSAHIDGRRERPYDIWSLGCIYMELIVWLTSGSDGLKGFRDRRAKELSIREEWEPAFHNGTAPLNEVLLMYEHARSRLKPYDDWSGIVLDLVEKHMLVSSKNERLGARDIHRLWKESVETPTHQPPVVNSIDLLQLSTCSTSSTIFDSRQVWSTNESARNVAEGELRCMDQSSLVELEAVPDLAFRGQELMGTYRKGNLERHRNRKHEILEAYGRRYSPFSTSAAKRNPLDSLGLGIQSSSYQKRIGGNERHPHYTPDAAQSSDTTISI
ncbi:kinase-like protein [Lindgomyces ingoldianus]|uniref:Kinase-like protein n=1 Tax=Lindgomyces ingoldianus TaxID=673940 RepID=A0ACB6QII8_9PLEO|nr:kinase-like protein [Lindgomyces ingoldianus]KAF2466682.1 kinase-like protein [Lindgomyces ingoldianus]